nr:MAG TPA: hypothetical protein [Caudoviricetes sp.]
MSHISCGRGDICLRQTDKYPPDHMKCATFRSKTG